MRGKFLGANVLKGRFRNETRICRVVGGGWSKKRAGNKWKRRGKERVGNKRSLPASVLPKKYYEKINNLKFIALLANR